MRLTRRKPKSKIPIIILCILIIVLIIFCIGYFLLKEPLSDKNIELYRSETEQDDLTDQGEDTKDDIEQNEKDNPYINIQLATAGDIMFHDDQLASAYDEQTKTYDFTPFFQDVKNILSTADLTIANFETTTAGPDKAYTGYPQFNSPDEVVDAIKDAGVDVLTTVNNHSLDTGSDGLKRTVKTIQERGIDTVGTYAKKPSSRVLIKEVEGIKFAIIAYTESTNGFDANYPPDELDSMLNLMEKDKIIADIEEAKQLSADFIISYMHWGVEYATEPNEKQIEFAEMMAEAGVDLILGSHPHVIQKSDIIRTDEKDTFVIYSMGNFISNQRQETLGDGYELTEDGIILLFDIQKNVETKETTIKHVEYIPTWVYRHQKPTTEAYDYRILPIDDFLQSDEIDEQYKQRMERSKSSTVSKMIESPFEN